MKQTSAKVGDWIVMGVIVILFAIMILAAVQFPPSIETVNPREHHPVERQ